jgi:hypothetical protein
VVEGDMLGSKINSGYLEFHSVFPGTRTALLDEDDLGISDGFLSRSKAYSR